MNELITITTGEQGSPVVSARDLYVFLEVKSKFADWIKARISRYQFSEGADFVTLSKNLDSEGFSKNLEKGGRPEIDYGLTLDMAKQLAMVERTDKGKQARLYFIEAEKTLRKAMEVPVLTPEQALLQLVSQQASILSDTQQMLMQLRADVDGIMVVRKPARPTNRVKSTPILPYGGPPTNRPQSGGSSLRQTIHGRVNEYCGFHQVSQSETYNYLYKRLNDVYGVNVYRLIKSGSESHIDAIERYGHLDRLYSLIMAELNYNEE